MPQPLGYKFHTSLVFDYIVYFTWQSLARYDNGKFVDLNAKELTISAQFNASWWRPLLASDLHSVNILEWLPTNTHSVTYHMIVPCKAPD